MHSALRKSGRFTAVSIAALLTGNPAFAYESPNQLLNMPEPLSEERNAINALNVDQSAATSQTVLNLAVGRSAMMDQAGVNVLNLVDVPGVSPNSVVQMADARQRVTNDLTAGDIVNSSQIAENYANIVRAENVGTVSQVFVEGSSQRATNQTLYTGSIDGLTQTASNVLNAVEVDGVANVVDQRFFPAMENTATQIARNKVTPSLNPGNVANVTQVASNIANTVTATNVGTIDRVALGDQLAENTIDFGDRLSTTVQFGQNIANVATVDGFDEIQQRADGDQLVVNRITSTASGMNGDVVTLSQMGVNIANVTYLPEDQSGAGTLINQANSLNQNVVNEINTEGSHVNVMQSSHNIANEIRIQE